MKNLIAATLAFVALLSMLLWTTAPASARPPGARYAVVFEAGLPGDAGALVGAAGGTLVKAFPQVGVAIATSDGPGFASTLEEVAGVRAVGLARFLTLPEADLHLAEGGPAAEDEGYHQYQWDIRRVGADRAWAVTAGSHDTVVAIIDTGVAYNHPDLAPNVIHNACHTAYAGDCNPYPSVHWHGTHVAGTVAAAFGGGRAVGVGPGLGLANYNVFEQGPDGYVAYDEAIWEAMLDAAERGFDVINMSIGDYVVRSDSPEDAAVWTAWNRVADYVTRQGVTIVASAGNRGTSLNGPLAHIPSDVTGILSVGATGIRPAPLFPQQDAYDVLAYYSNYGSAVTLVAPGGDRGGSQVSHPRSWYLVYSDYVYLSGPGYVPGCELTASCPTGYAWAAGTSMATPHVAGAAGLVKDAAPKLRPQQVTAILKQSAEKLGDRQAFGHGMLDVGAAVSRSRAGRK